MNISQRLGKNPNRVSENAHLRRAFAMAAPLNAYGKAIAPQVSNHRT
jgi:hypothetical protein